VGGWGGGGGGGGDAHLKLRSQRRQRSVALLPLAVVHHVVDEVPWNKKLKPKPSLKNEETFALLRDCVRGCVQNVEAAGVGSDCLEIMHEEVHCSCRILRMLHQP
jgi:hypothetical protein